MGWFSDSSEEKENDIQNTIVQEQKNSVQITSNNIEFTLYIIAGLLLIVIISQLIRSVKKGAKKQVVREQAMRNIPNIANIP